MQAEMTVENFNEEYNLSHIPEEAQTPSNEDILRHYLYSIAVYGSAILFLFINPLHHASVSKEVLSYLFYYYLTYVALAPIFLFMLKPKTVKTSNSVTLYTYAKKTLSTIFKRNVNLRVVDIKPTYKEKQSMILFFIKVFFGPLMIQFALSNLGALKSNLLALEPYITTKRYLFLSLGQLADKFYFIALNIIFFLDCSIFAIGYLSESIFLNNKIRYVEDSAFGLFICLICYPPFNTITSKIAGWYQDDGMIAFQSVDHPLTWVFRIIALAFIIIYVSASIALCTKASNLTNRGIVKKWPYNVVRHPAYISKICFWFFTTVPMLFLSSELIKSMGFMKYTKEFIFVFLITGVYAVIYGLRGYAEEKMLSRDPDYIEYKKEVRYRFIPGIF